MIKKALLLSTLSTLPMLNSASTVALNNTKNIEVKDEVNETEKEDEACTFMYVGKNVSSTGKAYVARSGDSSPLTTPHYAKIFAHNELAGQTVKGINGFEWKMPNETYRYISTPRNQNMGKSLHWEVSGINEKGVAVSATLSCSTYNGALKADPLELTTGITEDNLTQIVAAVSPTAKDGIKYIANIIDTVGSGEMNAIMVTDKTETWYMEMYTGHQYCAVKLPNDKACTIGNEFLLNTLEEFNDEDIITSPNLLKLAVDNNFAVFKTETCPKTLKNLHLFNTYAGEGDEQGGFADSCHMRTWIGHNLFAYNNEPQYRVYSNQRITGKLNPFFVPDNKLGPNDITRFMRDRFETILSNKDDPNYSYFTDLYYKNKLRMVGTESAYQIHIMSVDPELPDEISIQELMCLSNSNYSPFIPLNNGVGSLVDEYTKVTPYYTYDDSAALSIYKKLNTLAAQDRVNYGLPTANLIIEHEKAWQAQYDDIISQIKSRSLSEAKEIITNFCKSLQTQGLLLSKTLANDLLFHIENTTKGHLPSHSKFEPLVNLEYYSKLYGWNYKREDKKVVISSGNDQITFDINYYGKTSKCRMTLKDGSIYEPIIHINDNEPYVQHSIVTEFIAKNHDIAKLNADDYKNKSNPLVWILPVAIIVPIVITGSIVFVVIYRKKHNKKKSKK